MASTYPCPACGDVGAPGSHCPKDQTRIPFPVLIKGFQAGEYVGLEKIGEGGMGEVWRGEQPQIQKKVAIKILHEKIVQNADLVVRFQREALAVNKIESKHIVDIFSLGRLVDGRPYMVMEFLQGKSLQAFFDERGPLPYREILSLMEQLCIGLQAAHDAGIIHRDLKPENIFLVQEKSGRPFVKLLDFGIAKLQEGVAANQPQLTEANATFGTPAYISPEQLRGASEVDQRADIYSLGVILFEMVTGRTPYYEGNEPPMKVMLRHISQAIPRASEMVTGRAVPASLDQLLTQVLAKKAAQRPQSCHELFGALVHAIGDAKSPQLDVLKDAAPVWISDAAKDKQKHRLRASSADPTKQVQHQEFSRAKLTTERESIAAFEVPSSLGLSSGAWARWVGGVLLVASLVVGVGFFVGPKTRPVLVTATTQASLVTPLTQPSTSLPSASEPVILPAPTTATSVPSASAPVLTSLEKVPPKKESLRPVTQKTEPTPEPTPVIVTTPELPKETPKETANPFDKRETANPFGQKP